MAESQMSTTSGVNNKPRVFRVRNLPEHVDRLLAVELLCDSIDDIAAQDVRISSLAYDVDVWSWLRTKVATMTLQKIPLGLTTIMKGGECTIAVPGLAKPLIIDHNFQGMTPLNDVSDVEHKYDCLVISGLSSHPFGSWQIHGPDKTFMWIRDDLPHRLPGVRFLIYGYDTALAGSTSFQIIPDLAISLVQAMKATGCSAPSAKPVLFLAHSLGGVVLKQTLVLLAGGGSQERAILAKIRGAISFGVPSQGMNIPDILEMLGDQPNVALAIDLSNKSDFLPRLDEQFGNITYLQKQQFLWAFETKVTRIVEKANTSDKFARTGPGTVMVSRESATRNLYKLQPSLTIQIDKNHSDMVKFGMGDHYIGVLATELRRLCALPEIPTVQPAQPAQQTIRNLSQPELADPAIPSSPRMDDGDNRAPKRPTLQPEWTLPDIWDDNVILSSLRAPERDRRLEQINHKLGNTFNWVYDDASVGLSEWLQKGKGIFWINGKPASGKSTLMKYLYQDSRTDELLRVGSFKSKSRLMTASFFFHHRGNHMQKSFEGLLSSLVSQILEQAGSLVSLLYPILQDQYQAQLASLGLDSLESDIWALLDHFNVRCSSQVGIEVEKIVVSQWRLTKSQRFGTHLTRMLQGLGVKLDFSREGEFGEVDLGDSRTIMSAATEPKPKPGQDTPPEWSKLTRRTADVIRTLKQHYRREKIRMDIQTRRWSRTELEDCLRRLIGQSLFTMNLFLLLDALDEYDGRPEFIASFLQDLVQQPSDPSKQPSTHIRILFSSRPWKALSDAFAKCPGFQIHNYTWNDIIDFCAASIPAQATARTLLSPLVTEIVRRARGVFLWVELVMRDLAETVRHGLPSRDTQDLQQELRETLDRIPDELGDYYQIIIQRIPLGTRWESYVILETLSRADDDIKIVALWEILNCSYSKSVADAERRLYQDPEIPLDASDLVPGEGYVKAVSGGLVELSSPSECEIPIVQFMHQTVKQFVLGPWFRLQVLGTNIDALTTENGHSFISKHLFVNMDFHGSFSHHAKEAEATTGLSQYDFFNTAPPDQFSLGRPKKDGRDVPSVIAVAVFAGLQLCISDAYGAQQSWFQRNSETLVHLLLAAVRTNESLDDIINMAEILVAKGLSIHVVDDGLMEVVQHVWQRGWHGSSTSRGQEPTDSLRGSINPKYEQLACILAGAISLPSTPTEAPPSQSVSTRSTTRLRSTTETTQLLHCATPKLVRAFLGRGLDPNSLNATGNTPIDSVLAEKYSYSLNPREKLLYQYDTVSQLVRAGGTLRLVKRRRWEQWEKECANAGLDTGVFREAGFPRWYSKPQRLKGDGQLRRHLTKVFRVKLSNVS